VDDAQFVVDVDDGVDQLPEDDGGLVLLQEAVLFGVVEEVALAHEFGDDVEAGLGLELADEADDVGVVAVAQDPALPLDDLPLVGRQLEVLDDLNRHLLVGLLVLAPEHAREAASPHAFQPHELVEDGVLPELRRLLQPLLLHLLGLEVVLLGGVEAVPVLEDDAVLVALGGLDDVEAFQVDDVLGNAGFDVAEDEDGGLDELEVDPVAAVLVELAGVALEVGRDAQVEGLAVVDLPDVGVEASEVDVEQRGVLLDQLEEVLLRKLVLLLVQVVGGEQEVGVLLSQAGHVRPDLRVLPVLLEAFNGQDAALGHSLLPLLAIVALLREYLGIVLGVEGLLVLSLRAGLNPTEDLARRHIVLALLPLIVLLLALRLLVDDVLLLDLLVLRPEVVRQLVLPDVLQEGLLDQHLV
jgi:hypothetical protein